ncbi:ELWxxDGT repeat protein [Hyalangium versicolor]|uniref:ELWxxDGT repeat protein n=1 Tax=Hyalangium versicolor TaxID=2861190 RepID=UPI001CCEA691|nr:ELWxxDGT repeat protein [Hyalangium versicolor]
MKRTSQVSAMLIAGAMVGLAGCSESQGQSMKFTRATTQQHVEGPALLKDIQTEAQEFPRLHRGANAAVPLPTGGTLVALEEELTGEELWRTDGTEAGTTLVKDLAPGTWSSRPRDFTPFNGAIYFGAELEFGVNALLKTDGTEAGTVVVKFLPNAQEPDDDTFSSLVSAGGSLYFFHAEKLWKSDGTEAGTVSIQNLLPATAAYFSSRLVPLGNSVTFVADDSDLGAVLWKTDGTAAGTVLLKDLYSASNDGSPGLPVQLGQSLYFAAGDFNHELWKTDGTVAGTVLVTTLSVSINDLTAVGTQLFMDTQGGLWKTDGTEPGTVKLADYSPYWMEAVGGTLFFGSDDDAGLELWKSDGTVAGTSRVKDLFPGPDSSYASPVGRVNGRLLLVAAPGAGRTGLWISDGTEAGTQLLAERPGEWSSISTYFQRPAVPLGTTTLVELLSPEQKATAFRTDGTSTGTVALGSVRPGTKGSQLAQYPLTAVVGSKIFFQAREDSGVSLWVSDGTAGGTVLLRSFIDQVRSAARVGSTLFFSVDDGTHGTELWKSDGTAAGTVMVKEFVPGTEGGFPSGLAEFAGSLYFAARDSAGWELWKSDGTEIGTVLVRDLVPGNGNSNPSDFTVFNGTLFFAANDADSNGELWKTDGTAAGTVKVTNAEVEGLFVGGNSLYFVTNETDEGEALWKTDGTAAGTVLVRNGLDEVFSPTWANGKIYFMARDDAHGFEPWVSDGTTEGTRILKDIAPGSDPSFGIGFKALGNRVLFTARDDAHGFELWRTDGTEAGTERVTDLVPGARSSIRINTSDEEFNAPFELLTLDDRGLAVFAGSDEAGGVELWATDGTTAGTFRYADLIPGPDSSSPTGFAVVGGQLFFHAGDAAYGREPRAVPLPTSVDRTPPTVRCPGNVTETTLDAQGATVQYPAATASDEGGSPTLVYSQASGTHFAPGDTQVTVTATDSAGNTAQCSFTVTVRLDQVAAPDDEGEDSGCGCTSSLGAGAGAGWGLLLLSLASMRPGWRFGRKARAGRTNSADESR